MSEAMEAQIFLVMEVHGWAQFWKAIAVFGW